MAHFDLTAGITAAPIHPRNDAMIATGDAAFDTEGAVTFEELYAERYAAMVRLAHALVDTRQRAEEVVQDAFAAVFERFDRLETPEAYLRVCVLNNCRRVLRRRMLRRAQPVPVGADGELVFNHVVDAIRRLPHKQRSMIVLRYDLQLTDTEIAETLGVPIGTVKSTLHRALIALRQEIL
jgi:RNA polymerase sigma-70 factor (sigma-E family)